MQPILNKVYINSSSVHVGQESLKCFFKHQRIGIQSNGFGVLAFR